MSLPETQETDTTQNVEQVEENETQLGYDADSNIQKEEVEIGSSDPTELENQFILRLPNEPAAALREAVRSGAKNIKERLSIQLEPEKGTVDPRLRKGVVEFDGWNMSASVMDLPTIIESQKTIDRKTFYKTADISQIVICKEVKSGDEQNNEATPPKPPNKYDPNKVDKKYLYYHGITPPLKNCRRRRFRKTLEKKFIEAPEIEKEIRRLFRVDEEAIDVKWELITDDQLNAGKKSKMRTECNPGASLLKNSFPDEDSYDQQDLFGALSESDEDREEDSDDGDSPPPTDDLNGSETFDLSLENNFDIQNFSSYQRGNEDVLSNNVPQNDYITTSVETFQEK